MKKYARRLLVVIVLSAPVAADADSFRLENGQLLREGMSKTEVLEAAGKPKMKDTTGKARGRPKKEIWTYYVNNTFGTPSVVSVTFEGGAVTHVKAKERTRP